jgi:hypothetical protein
LGLDRVLRIAKKLFDPQVLFDPFKEYLHSPPISIQFSNGKRWQGKMIRKKDE